uniref:Uncharacterized protein n=1 Tax=Oryza brachyantha TaxID=4533 RepID=J3MHQ7_ORYBR
MASATRNGWQLQIGAADGGVREGGRGLVPESHLDGTAGARLGTGGGGVLPGGRSCRLGRRRRRQAS